MGKFVIKQRTNNEYQFNLKAGNREIILSSEGYATKHACKNGIKSAMEDATDEIADRIKLLLQMISITTISSRKCPGDRDQ
jgi:uncharacterized protein YegP (UPF0339 family)